MNFDPWYQYGNYVVIWNKRERRRKMRRLRRRMEVFIPEEFWADVTWIKQEGHPRSRDPYSRPTVVAWKW
jgi:hypothetical protein